MKTLLVTVSVLTVIVTPVFAGDSSSSAVGVGVGVAKSSSQSTAVAVSGQGGGGGNGGNVTINSITPPVTTSNINQTISGATTSHVVTSGTSTVRTNPAVFAPGLAAAGLETCLGAASGGLSLAGFGLTGGSSFPDEGCQARLDSRTLWSMGLKAAALARLCQREAVYRSMPDVCDRYTPRAAPTAGVYLSTSSHDPSSYTGGSIMLVDGKTGLDRLCRDYDAPGQRCRVWANVVSHHKSVKPVSHRARGDFTPAAKPVAATKPEAKPEAKPADAPAVAAEKKDDGKS